MGFALSTGLRDFGDHKLTSHVLSDVFGNLCLCEIGVPASAVNIN
jgi:hypothetical protein